MPAASIFRMEDTGSNPWSHMQCTMELHALGLPESVRVLPCVAINVMLSPSGQTKNEKYLAP